MFLFGPPDVEKMKARRDVNGLIKALKYKKSWEVREAAARALGEIKDPRAVEPLSAALKDGSVGEAAVEALGKIGDPCAVEPLIAQLKNEYRRTAATKALSEIGAFAVEPLVSTIVTAYRAASTKIRDYENKSVYEAAIAALKQIKDVRAVEPLIAVLRDVLRDVRDECWLVRPAAAEALGQIGDPRAVEPLIAAALKDKESGVRKAAAQALGNIKDPRAVEPLIAVLKDEEWYVRKAAAESLDRLGWKPGRDEAAGWYWMVKRDWDKCVALGAPAVEPLIAALKDWDNDVRRAAAETLVKIGPPAVEPLIAALKDEEQHARKAAAEALGKIGDARAVEPLIAALGDKSSGVRQAAAEALDKLGWKPARDESAAWYWATKGKWNACVDIGAPAVQPLITSLSVNDPYTRRDVAQALVRLYQKSNISQEDQEQILAVRDHLIRIHDDQPHIDEFKDCSNNRPHTDIELGVEFPL